MAMTAAQIAQELQALESKTTTCAKQLRELYQRYLAELSNTASQQLMSVCYHLCTESFPEAFLGLSPSERQALQGKVREQGNKLREHLSLDGLLLPDVGDLEEGQPPRIAVIKAELTGDDLEVITNALDEDNGDRILALLREKDIELPFDLEAVMQQRLKPEAVDDDSESVAKVADSEKSGLQDSVEEGEPGDGEPDDVEPLTDSDSVDLETSAVAVEPEAEEEPGSASELANEAEGVAVDREPSGVVEASVDAQSVSGEVAEAIDSASSSGSRSLGRRFLEDILSRRALDRRRSGENEIVGVAGEGSLRIESEAPVVSEEDGDRATQLESTLEEDEIDVQDNFDDKNGFDPNFEPPPAEDRYEPTPLKSSDKLDISPGVLASALAAEGDDERRGMLMRPSPYDGTTELSDEALRDPFALIRWVERMERGISQRLRQSSQRTTRSLEKSRILNNELPDGLLEAAVRPDGDHEDDSDGSMPHVLRLKLNAAGKEGRPRKGKSIRIVAIYLRLSEIEFATPGVMAWRNQLRNQVKQLRRLSKEYKDCKHAQDVVKAQELWRRGWVE